MHREELRAYLDTLLDTGRFRDYCPNGMQVEGRTEVRRILCGVTASQRLIETAIECEADTLLVHHGWFWKSEDGRVTGFRKQRLAALLKQDINLFAYHLPLDAHLLYGNNAQLAVKLGWQVEGRFGEQEIGYFGVPPVALTAAALASQVGEVLGRTPQLLGDASRIVRRIAWCSGGAQGYFEQALAIGADCYLSGEVSEQNYHLALETGMPFIAAGHHATERYGVQAVGQHLAETFGLDCRYVELDNPV